MTAAKLFLEISLCQTQFSVTPFSPNEAGAVISITIYREGRSGTERPSHCLSHTHRRGRAELEPKPAGSKGEVPNHQSSCHQVRKERSGRCPGESTQVPEWTATLPSPPSPACLHRADQIVDQSCARMEKTFLSLLEDRR